MTVDLRVDWRGFRQRDGGGGRYGLMVVVTTVASLVVVA